MLLRLETRSLISGLGSSRSSPFNASRIDADSTAQPATTKGVDPATARSVLAEDERSELAAALVARTRAPDWSVPPQLR